MGVEQDHLCAVAQASNCRGLVLCINIIYIYNIILINLCISFPSKCSIAACRYFWSFGRDLCDESCDAMFEICVCASSQKLYFMCLSKRVYFCRCAHITIIDPRQAVNMVHFYASKCS